MPPKKTKKSPKERAAAVADGITIRMFCQGLGDCFLITIPQGDSRPYTILIDCGVAKGTAGEGDLMREVVNKIAALTRDATTQKGMVDLLIVTHEHYDHVCGFAHARNELATIEFKQVWYAWTESRRDDLANELRLKHAKDKATLTSAFAAVRALASAASPSQKRFLRSLAGVASFYEPIAAAKTGSGKLNVAEAMAAAGKLQKTGDPETLMPGKVSRLPGAAAAGMARDIRAYILGPPHNAKTLRSINPHKKNPETYEKASLQATLAWFGMSWAWTAAMNGHAAAAKIDNGGGDDTEVERAMPFDNKWRRKLETVRKSKDEFFKHHYFADDAQRRIDEDWLYSGAQQLALYMESYTNNTSLAVAFELPTSKKVLLFAADAQVGSWLSWHDIPFQDGSRNLKATDLLANTVLYKVGHHGSHNATLREKGLEMMIHPELVAMLPVEQIAVDRLGYGEMPLGTLLTRLGERAQGRVLHLDKKWTDGKAPGTWRPGMIKARLADETFKAGADGRALYMEYTVADK